MSTLRERRPRDHQEPNKNTKPNEEINDNELHETPKISVYEQTREERIKENHERMQKLGLMDLSLKLKACTAPSKRTPRTSPSSTKHPTPLLPRGPLRRSSRLQNSTPVSYSEVALTKKDGLLENENMMQEVGSKPEVYTEEHEKLLGNTERNWTLFVDGCGKNGKRIYDSINGKTCHQCRQKTLGYRTHCWECKMVQGQFCGDCLYMRYGEHVLEALENPNWLCPVCRGICNCSLCRQGKGWPPTGTLYRKISSLGYKSVAHYLIQTKRLQNTANEVSAKRSLPFSNMEVVSEESPQFIYKTAEQLEHQSEDKILDELDSKTENKISSSRNLTTDGQTKRALTFSSSEVKSENVESAKVNHEVHDNLGLSKPQCEEMNNEFEKEKHMQSNGNRATACQTDKSLTFSGSEARSKKVDSAGTHEIHDDLALSMPKSEDMYENEFKSEEEKKETIICHEIHDDLALSMPKFEGNIPSESCLKHKRKHASAINPSPDSVAARLRQRRWKSNGKDDAEFMGVDEKASNVKPAVNAMSSSQNMEEENEMHVEDGKRFVLESSQLKKRTQPEPNPDSIGARLRQRHRTGKGHENNEFPGTRLRSRG
ncbi:hypothetical protein NC651_017958 [Populus alba x Populus x berolinensis]|nr:hypothetical protein NC651_017958 [Populus alba x Populus x berolinensis]